ncbi:MAG: GNAT family N-acetyltransferase [Pyrinomonadaceae bacterium]
METTQPTYQLRNATNDDLEFAIELNRLYMQPYRDDLPGWTDRLGRAEMQRRWVADPYQMILVDGERVGLLVVTERDDQLILKQIELMPTHQGKGIGSEVIRDVLKQASARGLGVTLYVLRSNPAVVLYERLGFYVVEVMDTGWRGVKYRMILAN